MIKVKKEDEYLDTINKHVTIECEAEVDINEYVENIDDDVLLEEVLNRSLLSSRETQSLIHETELVELICVNKSIVEAQKIRDFFGK